MPVLNYFTVRIIFIIFRAEASLRQSRKSTSHKSSTRFNKHFSWSSLFFVVTMHTNLFWDCYFEDFSNTKCMHSCTHTFQNFSEGPWDISNSLLLYLLRFWKTFCYMFPKLSEHFYIKICTCVNKFLLLFKRRELNLSMKLIMVIKVIN